MKIAKKIFFLSVIIYLVTFLYIRLNVLAEYEEYVWIPAITGILSFLIIIGITVKAYTKQPLEIFKEVLLFVFSILFTLILVQVF